LLLPLLVAAKDDDEKREHRRHLERDDDDDDDDDDVIDDDADVEHKLVANMMTRAFISTSPSRDKHTKSLSRPRARIRKVLFRDGF